MWSVTSPNSLEWFAVQMNSDEIFIIMMLRTGSFAASSLSACFTVIVRLTDFRKNSPWNSSLM